MLGLEIDEPIATAVSRLSEKGVRIIGSILNGESGKFAHLEDPDGNDIFLWEINRQVVSEPQLAHAGTA